MGGLAPDELAALEDALARLLRDRCTEQQVRADMGTDAGYSPALWHQLAEMGITGLLVDPRFGGSNAGPVAVERVMEHAGAALLCAPMLASSVLAAGVLAACGDETAQQRLLPGVAAGEIVATMLLTGPAGTWTPDGVAVRAVEGADGWALDGVADYVLHARNADVYLAVADTRSGLTLFQVSPGAAGVSLTRLPSFDHTLRIDRIELSGTPAHPVGPVGHGWPAVEHALALGRVAMAGEQAGAARRLLDMTVAYAKERHQFGRPIGSFQAIKHMAADLLVEAESATSAARHAATVLAEGLEDASTWVSLAAFACADAFSKVAADAVQMHGGIAFTWDHPAHLYLRRARADAQLLGSSDDHREQYLRQLGG